MYSSKWTSQIFRSFFISYLRDKSFYRLKTYSWLKKLNDDVGRNLAFTVTAGIFQAEYGVLSVEHDVGVGIEVQKMFLKLQETDNFFKNLILSKKD